jgi:hypothetical protein
MAFDPRRNNFYLSEGGPFYNGQGPSGAQTERRGGAGPVRGLLGGKDLTGRLKLPKSLRLRKFWANHYFFVSFKTSYLRTASV